MFTACIDNVGEIWWFWSRFDFLGVELSQECRDLAASLDLSTSVLEIIGKIEKPAAGADFWDFFIPRDWKTRSWKKNSATVGIWLSSIFKESFSGLGRVMSVLIQGTRKKSVITTDDDPLPIIMGAQFSSWSLFIGFEGMSLFVPSSKHFQ